MPSNAAPLQSISITRIENRTLPTPHLVYAILVALPVRSWTVFRRYSEFLALHQTFTDGKDGTSEAAPPSPFPAKNTARKTLKTITALGGLLPQSETSKDVEEAYVKERRNALEKYLRVIVSSPDSRWRDSDAFKAFIELPKTETASSLGGPGRPMNSAAATSSRYVPGSYSNANHAKPASESNGFTARRLGTFARETEATRRLDEDGLFASQQAQMNAQDSQLDGLAAILRRQKAMGLAINQELLEQSELLETLDQEVDQTQSKMSGAERQMKKLER